MVDSLLTNEIEKRRKSLASRLADALEKNKQKGICPKINNCSYVIDNVNAVNMTCSEADVYIGLICEDHSSICELNMNKN